MTDAKFGLAGYGLVFALIDHLEDTKVLSPIDGERIFAAAATLLAEQGSKRRGSEMRAAATFLTKMRAEALLEKDG